MAWFVPMFGQEILRDGESGVPSDMSDEAMENWLDEYDKVMKPMGFWLRVTVVSSLAFLIISSVIVAIMILSRL